VAFAMASLSAVFRPAQAAIIPTLLPKQLYRRAIGFSYAAFHCTELLGPTFAAALFAASAPDRALFYLDAASFAIAALLSSTIARSPAVRDSNKRSLHSVTQDLRNGASILWARPNCMVYTALACVLLLTEPLIVVATLQLALRVNTAVMSYDRAYSLLALASGVALVAGSLLGGRWKAVGDKPQIPGALTILGGLVLLVSGLLSPNWVIIIGFLMFRMSFSLNLTSISGHFAEHIPNESRGRVYAVVNSLCYLAGAVGAAFAGWCANLSPWQGGAIAGATVVAGTVIVLTKAGMIKCGPALLPATQIPH
jgi:MFS transporter